MKKCQDISSGELATCSSSSTTLTIGQLMRPTGIHTHPPSMPPSSQTYTSTLVPSNAYLLCCKYRRLALLKDTHRLRLTYNSRTSTPFVSLAGAAEDESLCGHSITPNDLSETFLRRGVSEADVERRARSGDRAAELVILGGVSSHQEAVLKMIQMWDDSKDRRHPDQQLFGRITYLWQEILNRIEGFDCYDRFTDMDFWPRAARGCASRTTILVVRFKRFVRESESERRDARHQH